MSIGADPLRNRDGAEPPSEGRQLTKRAPSANTPTEASTSGDERSQRLLESERLRFLLVGGFNTAFGYSAFVAIQFAFGSTIGYLGSLFCAHVIASSVAFILYRRLVFRVAGSVALDYVRFQGVYLVALAINVILLPILVECFGWNVYLAQGSILTITVIGSFVGHKYFSFRRKPQL